MTSTTRTPSSTTDGTAELADAIARREFYRLRPDWLDVPLIARDPDIRGLVHTLYALRRLP